MEFVINGRTYYLGDNNMYKIEDLYLFGSVARNDAEENSDIDLLVIIEDCAEKEYIELKDNIAKDFGFPQEWISVYQKSKIEAMHEKGSYFLWHIKLEGKLLYTANNYLARLLDNLPEYKESLNDLQDYEQICQDIKVALKTKDIEGVYELSLLASIIRNTCIAIDYLCEQPTFGRVSAVETCMDLIEDDLGFSVAEYRELYKFRLFMTGKSETAPDYQLSDIEKWLKHAENLIIIGKKRGMNYVE